MRFTSILLSKSLNLKPKSSQVLTAYLKQCNIPPWTSYFVRLTDCENDLKGNTSFNFTLDTGDNYHILRTWCFPYIKFHCTKSPIRDLSVENKFYEVIKVINLGIPTVLYGLAAIYLIRHEEEVYVPETKSKLKIYFLIPEEKGSQY